MNTLQSVRFHGDTIQVTQKDNEPYVAMKPIVENMGLDWSGQYSKLNHNRKRWSVEKISMVALDNRKRSSVCIPLRKLPGYFATINANKVRNDLRKKIILYQNECDDALWEYWKGAQFHPDLPVQTNSVDPVLVGLLSKVPKHRLSYVYGYLGAMISYEELSVTINIQENKGK